MRPVEGIMSPTLDRSWSVSLVSTKYVVSFSGIAGGRSLSILEVHKQHIDQVPYDRFPN